MTKPQSNLELKGDPSKTDAQNQADVATGGTANSAMIATGYSLFSDASLTETFKSIRSKAELASSGNLKDQEAMLVSQAIALDAIFTSLAMRAKNNLGEYMNAAETYLRLALKAQSQCRTTIEALAEIKNPKPYIQNNRAQYQQVNNAVKSDILRPVHAGAPARENQNTSNELLEDKADEQQWMDGSPSQAASGVNQEMEAVEA